jgi:hypothetical protein
MHGLRHIARAFDCGILANGALLLTSPHADVGWIAKLGSARYGTWLAYDLLRCRLALFCTMGPRRDSR